MITTSSYRYDGLGRRIEKVTNGQTRRYIYDGEDILLQYDGANELQAPFEVMRLNMSLACFFLERSIVTAIIVAAFLFVTAPAYAEGDSFVTPAILLGVLGTQDIDKIRGTLGSVRKMHYKGEILPILHDVWKENRQKYSDLAWSTLRKPIVKAELANVLTQAWRNGAIKLDAADVHSVTAKLLDAEDVEVVLIALQTLEAFESENDVTKIVSIAQKGEMGTFQMAISTLTLMCNPVAEKAVLALISETKDKDSLLFIKETKAKADLFKGKTSLCSSKKKLPLSEAK
ncbi:MAG: hypothetical protein LKG23_00490 [Nitrospira sp.]|nr:hypothetical protein [Nitrospira sp.]